MSKTEICRDDIISFTGEDGEELFFEVMDLVPYQEENYAVLIPQEDEPSEIVILKLESTDQEENSFTTVEDQNILDAVFELFKSRNEDLFTNFSD